MNPYYDRGDWYARLALNSKQWDSSTDALHVGCVLAVVHGVKGALIASDTELAPH